jgi:hypothetical protein
MFWGTFLPVFLPKIKAHVLINIAIKNASILTQFVTLISVMRPAMSGSIIYGTMDRLCFATSKTWSERISQHRVFHNLKWYKTISDVKFCLFQKVIIHGCQHDHL